MNRARPMASRLITVLREIMKSSSRIGFGTLHTKSRLINSLRSSKREQRPAISRRKTG